MPTALALQLAEDLDDFVRLFPSMREDLTEQQRSAIAYIVPNGYRTPPRWIVEHGHRPHVARRAAASGHVLLRRSIAMQPTSPPTWWIASPRTRTSSSDSPCASRARTPRTHSYWRCTPTGTASDGPSCGATRTSRDPVSPASPTTPIRGCAAPRWTIPKPAPS
ncbi:hypothetical protein GFH48_02970 [Streptomyces fagopyri]|uniref:Uncharacterized protein n=1 Tax=Streptomyces fagopyri TaxID=2662397 RepID=A0A5Q0L654_9ACTN|nr:hypothetical protein [Streptomyces fagopyri]QFZ72358.1 hypothetical protein GFH48_02970 [Streptomyces fagopyri]